MSNIDPNSGFGISLVGAQQWPPEKVRIQVEGIEEPEQEVPITELPPKK